MAAGCEEAVSSRELFSAERKNRDTLGVLADMPVYSFSYSQIQNSGIKESYLGIVKREKSDIVKIVNQSETRLRWNLSFVFLQ